MTNWKMLTVVGADQPGIVAKLTEALYQAGCNLGEASMLRLGANFTMMLMVNPEGEVENLHQTVQPVTDALNLHYHIDDIDGHLHQHRVPDVHVTVYGADRPGIVSEVTTRLAAAGLHILELDTDVAGDDAQPVFIMHIEGHAGKGMDALRTAVDEINDKTIIVTLSDIDTLIG